ncbi:MAG: sigma-70 family RNA polymerase sigma factor [Polyangiaceae bacterium]|nr:sigma-70 family RNA polymerase sigma factor [Polyangiaceae bacterium]
MSDLVRLLQEACARAGRVPDPADRLEVLAATATDRARGAWPELDVDLRTFYQHLVTVMAEPSAAELEKVAIEDLYLAFACGHGIAGAVQAFDREYARELEIALTKMRLPPDRASDARQDIRERLFVGFAKSPPQILRYSGTGRLRPWFRVTVAHALMDDLRRQKNVPRSDQEEAILGVPAPEPEPELEYLKTLYGSEFRTAFEETVHALDPEDRNLLRMHYARGLTTAQIACAFGVHRATAARQVARARDRLAQGTRDRMKQRLRLTTREQESVLRLIESQIHVSIQRLL